MEENWIGGIYEFNFNNVRFIGRKIKNLETEVGNINSTLDNVSPAPKVIPIERGGTGATTTNGALDNLFGESPLPISRGGTGVNTQEKLSNLCVGISLIEIETTLKGNSDNSIKYSMKEPMFPIKPGYTGYEFFIGELLGITTNVQNSDGGKNSSYVNVYGVYFSNNNEVVSVKCRNFSSSEAVIRILIRVAYIPKPEQNN